MNLGSIKHRIAKTLGLVKDEVIPPMEDKRAVIEQYRAKYKPVSFVETGTFWGDTIEFFKNDFAKLYSIELSEDLHGRAVKRFAADPHVSILQGDSSKIFPDLLPRLQQVNLFWLDGHYSSEFFVGEEFIKTAKGDKNTPVEEELITICRHCPGTQVVLIDDARLFNGKHDYPTIEAIKNLLDKAGRSYTLQIDVDIIQIVLS